jgi:hypothetical protein
MQHERSKRRDEEVPNRAANVEKAEGSREETDRGVGSEVPPEAFGEQEEGGGISNRPIDEEMERQERVPPRGERRDDEGSEDVER